MNTNPQINVADPRLLKTLTDNDWKQLELCGVLIKGGRIIRTLAFIKGSEARARQHIIKTAKSLFS